MSKHTCVSDLDNLLLEHNTQIAVAIDFSGEGRELIQVTTMKVDDKIRKKPKPMFASHCPFCGVKLKGM